MSNTNPVVVLTVALALGVATGCEMARPSARTAMETAVSPPTTTPNGPSEIRYRLADCHVHLVDFLQRGDGIEAVLRAMDRCGVDHAAVSGMPLVKKWDASAPRRPLYYLEDDARTYWYSATDVHVAREVLSLPPGDRARVHPFICGFNGTDLNAVDHVRRMLEWYPDLWSGIGEVMGRHDDLTALTYGETPRANHPALDPVYALAAEHDLPVAVHSNIGSVWKREPIYLAEMEEAVRRHPDTKFIWCHAGISRRIVIPDLTQHLRRMLNTYPNLDLDISWVVYEEYIAPGGAAAPDWVALIEAFPDRFLLGSDKVGKFDDYEGETLKYYVLLDALRPETARRVARDNLMSLLPSRPLRRAAYRP